MSDTSERKRKREGKPGQLGRKTDETAAARHITLRGAQREEGEREGEKREGFRGCPRHVCLKRLRSNRGSKEDAFAWRGKKKKKKSG